MKKGYKIQNHYGIIDLIHIINVEIHITNVEIHIRNVEIHITNVEIHIRNDEIHITNLIFALSSLKRPNWDFWCFGVCDH